MSVQETFDFRSDAPGSEPTPPIPDWAAEDGVPGTPASQMPVGPRSQYLGEGDDVSKLYDTITASGHPRRPHDGQDLKEAIEQGGGAAVELDWGHYRVPNPIHIDSHRMTIRGASRNSRISRNNPDEPLFHFARPARKQMGITLENLYFFERNHGNAPLIHNLGADGRDGAILEDLTFRDCWFKNVGFNGVLMLKRAIRMNIENCKFEDCSARLGGDKDRGIVHTFQGSADVHMDGCVFDQGPPQHPGTVWLYEGGGTDVTNGGARLQNSVIMRADRSIVWKGIWQVALRNVVFDGHLRPPLMEGVGTIRVSDISTTGWRGAHGMVIAGGDNHNISNSRFQYSSGNIGLNLINVTDTTVSNSSFRHFSQGLRVGGSHNVTVSNVVCADNGGHGLVINQTGRPSNFVQVNGGMYRNNNHGIGVYGSDEVDILNARSHGNANKGVNIDGSNDNVRVKNVTATQNGGENIAWGDPGGRSERRLNTSAPADSRDVAVAAAPIGNDMVDPDDGVWAGQPAGPDEIPGNVPDNLPDVAAIPLGWVKDLIPGSAGSNGGVPDGM